MTKTETERPNHLGIDGSEMGKTNAVILSVIFGLVAACQSIETTELTGSAQVGGLLPKRLTLLNWNAQKLHDSEIEQDLSTLIRQHKPDLVFLQEVNIDRLNSDQMGGHFAEAWSYPWPGGTSVGVLTLSHSWPIRSKPVQTEWREFFVITPKVSLISEYLLPNGDTLLAVNVHLLNFESWEPFMLRSQLEGLELAMASHDGPIIMAGDFNTWSETRLALVDDLARKLQLEEITGFPQGRKTGELDSDLLHWIFAVNPDLPLDRVYSRGYEVVSVQVLPNDSSDHRPVLVTLNLDPEWRNEPKPQVVVYCSDKSRTTNVGKFGASYRTC